MNTRDANSQVVTRTRPPSCGGSHFEPEEKDEDKYDKK